jgi:hypothetical protein
MHFLLLFAGLVLAWGLMGPNPRAFLGWCIIAIVVGFVAILGLGAWQAYEDSRPVIDTASHALTFDDLPIAPTCSASITHKCWREACQKAARCSMDLWQE